MVDTVDGAPSGPAHAARGSTSAGDRVRFVLRGVGQTLITAGVVVLLFVVYEVYVTNYFAHAAQSRARTALKKTWVDEKADPLLPLPGQSLPSIPEGKGMAILYIPRLGNDYSFAIVQGTSDKDLAKGPGHYKGTALPGQLGNFAVAGHRVGNGEPFLNLDHLRAGDPIIIQTESKWYVYKVKGQDHHSITSADADGIPGREVVNPGQGGRVLTAVPDHPAGTPVTERLITLTTCHPKFTAADRMVVYGALSNTYKADGLTMPSAVQALYTQQES